jgi:hypothetical protein
MVKRNWTVQKFDERIEAVLAMEKHGPLSFDAFLYAETTYDIPAQKVCQIHPGENFVNGHCPKCWSDKPVPIPPFVMAEIRRLENQMTVRHCKKHKRDFEGVCPACQEESERMLNGKQL